MSFTSQAQEAAYAMRVLASMHQGCVYYLVLAPNNAATVDELSRICSSVIAVSGNASTNQKTKV